MTVRPAAVGFTPSLGGIPDNPPSGLRQVLEDLGSPDARRLRVVLIDAPLSIVGALTVHSSGANDIAGWTLAAVMGSVAMVLAFSGAGRATRGWSGRRGVIATAVAIVAALVTRGVVLIGTGALVTEADVNVANHLWVWSSAFAFQSAVLVLIALVSSARERQRRHFAAKEQLARQLVYLQNVTRDDGARVALDARMTVDGLLRPLAGLLESDGRSTGVTDLESESGRSSLSARAREAAEGVRNLSHELLTQASDEPRLSEVPAPALRRRIHLELVPFVDLLPVPLILLVGLVGSLSASVRSMGSSGFIGAAVILGVGLPLMFGARYLLRRWEPAPARGIVAVAGLWIVDGLAVQVALRFAPAVPDTTINPVAQVLIGGALGAIVASFVVLRRASQAAERESNALLVEIREQTLRAVRASRGAQRRVGRLLHGSIQATLWSIAGRLEHGVVTADTLDELVIELAEAQAVLHEPRKTDLRSTATSLERSWAGVMDVSVSIPDAVVELLSRHQATAEDVSELLVELVANSARHGRATKVDVELGTVVLSRRESVLRLEATDNGSAGTSPEERGMGSALMDLICDRWSRARSGEGCRVVAEIAVSSADGTRHA